MVKLGRDEIVPAVIERYDSKGARMREMGSNRPTGI